MLTSIYFAVLCIVFVFLVMIAYITSYDFDDIHMRRELDLTQCAFVAMLWFILIPMIIIGGSVYSIYLYFKLIFTTIKQIW